MTAIFQDTHQAVKFSFLIESLPVKQDSAIGKAIQKAAEEAGLLERTERSSINFDGLNDLEVRGQAAMVRLAVQAYLPGPESWAVRAKFGTTAFSTEPGGKRRAWFPVDRELAMRSVAGYLSATVLDNIEQHAALMVVVRVCAESDAMRPTLQAIVDACGGSVATYHRAEKKARHRIRELVNAGLDRLTPIFEREELVAAVCA